MKSSGNCNTNNDPQAKNNNRPQLPAHQLPPFPDTVHKPTNTQHHARHSTARHDPEIEDTIQAMPTAHQRDDVLSSQQKKTVMTRPCHKTQVRSTQRNAQEKCITTARMRCKAPRRSPATSSQSAYPTRTQAHNQA